MTVRKGVDLPALALTLAIGTVGGAAAALLNLPLAWMLGALVATGGIALAGLEPFGKPILLPARLRTAAIPVIGVAIGGAFTPEVLTGAAAWWPSLLALLLFVPLMHGVGFLIYRRGGLPALESAYGAVPGGLIETVQLAEESGADTALVVVLQFLRLILSVVAVPLIFILLTGGAVGSAAGVSLPGAEEPLTLLDLAILLGLAAVGHAGGRAVRLPAAMMTGPLLLSAVAHATGLVHGVPPDWMIAATQVVVGCGLGARFAGVSRRLLARALPLAVANGAVALALAYGTALILGPIAGEPPAAVFLAFAPGGLAEMSLIALSLNLSIVYVTLHHVARIVLSLLMARAGTRLLRR